MGDPTGKELREVAVEAADALGIPTAGMPTKGKAALPFPEYDINLTGQHSFIWRDEVTKEMFKVIVAHPVRSGRDFWCELTVYYRQGNDTSPIGILNSKRWNLTSTSSTDAQIRSLKRRMPEALWDARLSQVEFCIHETVETGDELLDLSGIENPPPAAYAVWPFLEEGEHNGVAAEGGSTKSIFAMACCISYSYGVVVIPGTVVPSIPDTGPRPSLYLDYESTSHTQAFRRRQLLEGIGHAEQGGKIFYKRMYSPVQDAANELYDIIKSRNIGLVVIDSASRAVGGETSTEALVIPFFNAVASWGTTVLTVAHKSKDRESQGPSGVAQWFNQFRNYWEIVKDQTPGQPEVHLAFRHDKANDESLHKPMNYRLEFNDKGITYYEMETPRATKILAEMPLSVQITAFLEEFPQSTVKEVALGIEKGDNHVRNELNKNEGVLFYGSKESSGRRWANIPLTTTSSQLWWSE